MTKRAFDKIAAGLAEVAAYKRGELAPSTYHVHVPAKVDVRAIRTRMGLTQQAFAARFGFSAAAVRDWEQERKAPEAAARMFLTVIDREPEAVSRALEGAAI